MRTVKQDQVNSSIFLSDSLRTTQVTCNPLDLSHGSMDATQRVLDIDHKLGGKILMAPRMVFQALCATNAQNSVLISIIEELALFLSMFGAKPSPLPP